MADILHLFTVFDKRLKDMPRKNQKVQLDEPCRETLSTGLKYLNYAKSHLNKSHTHGPLSSDIETITSMTSNLKKKS